MTQGLYPGTEETSVKFL